MWKLFWGGLKILQILDDKQAVFYLLAPTTHNLYANNNNRSDNEFMACAKFDF